MIIGLWSLHTVEAGARKRWGPKMTLRCCKLGVLSSTEVHVKMKEFSVIGVLVNASRRRKEIKSCNAGIYTTYSWWSPFFFLVLIPEGGSLPDDFGTHVYRTDCSYVSILRRLGIQIELRAGFWRCGCGYGCTHHHHQPIPISIPIPIRRQLL